MSLAPSRLAAALVLGCGVLAACSSDDKDPTGPGTAPGVAEISGDITADRTLYADTTYTLTDFVHVVAPAKLTIQAGTEIRGRVGSALFILPGAQILANGRADAPIVLTSSEPVGQRQPGDWGGLILVGRGIINRTGNVELEGTNTSARNYSVLYNGGTNNADNSGVLRYVRVEFAGFGPAANQELNSFTFAAVGSGTTVEHVQSLAGLDDSFEWFGGAVNGRYLVSYEAGDDHFDGSEGYVGRNQYLIAYQSDLLDPRPGSGDVSSDPQGFEMDNCGSASGSGCTQGYDSEPLTQPFFANFTLVGSGPVAKVLNKPSGGIGMVIRRGAAGHYVNGIVARWPKAALSLRDAETEARARSGELSVRNLYVVETGATAGTNAPLFESGSGRFTLDEAVNSLTSAAGATTAASIFQALPAVGAVPTLAGIDFALTAGAAPRTLGTGAFTGALQAAAGGFVTGTPFVGAWDPTGAKWWQGWTNYARN